MSLLFAAEESESPGLVDPVWGLMVWTLVVFGLTMYVLWKVAFPRIAEALESFRMARATLEQGKAPPRQVADALQWIGRVHYYAPAPQLAKARAALEECVRLDPGHAEAYYFLGLVELDDKRYRAAVGAFERAVAADPTGNPESWYYLGEAADLAKLPQKAKVAYTTYLQRCETVQCYQVDQAKQRLKGR